MIPGSRVDSSLAHWPSQSTDAGLHLVGVEPLYRDTRLPRMSKQRLEAFSDAVIAILITIMVLELRAPHGSTLAALRPLVPTFLAYVLSFVYLGIYLNNHHHLFHAATGVSGSVLWANLHLLFWLSLIPFATSWVGESP